MNALKGMSRIVVFGAEYCNFCKKAKTMLTKAQVKFNYIDVNEEDQMEVLTALQRENNYYKIPMVFLD
jgi:glutaredoxin